MARLVRRYKDLSGEEHIGQLAYRALDKALVYATAPIKKQTYAKDTFSYRGQKMNYAVYSYNATWRNERAIEVPIMLDFIREFQNQRILEVGNVSRYYGDFKHDVIDKYENSDDIMNIDIMDCNPENPYDAFLAISTFEHIGWDEPTKEPEKILAAVKHVYKLVNNKDNVLISCPLGYNDALDDYIRNNEFPFQDLRFLRRKNQGNQWVETSKDEALSCKYGSTYPAANSIFVGRGLK